MKYFVIFLYLIAQNGDSRELQAVKRDNPES